jgi:hypothetical protein
MSAGAQLLHPVAQQGQGGSFLGLPQDPVIGSPQHLQRLWGQGVAAASEAAAAGEAT